MAVAVDALGAGTTWNNEQNKTWLHTASGSNRYVVTTVAHAQGATNYSSSQTYDGAALGALTQQVNGLALAEIWGLAAPSTTSGATVAVNMAQGGHYGTGNSASFTEVAQSSSSDAPETFNITTTTSESQAFTSANGDAVVSVVSLIQGGSNSVDTGTAIMTGSGGLGFGGPSAYALSTGATATLAYSWGNTVSGVHTGVNLNQASGSGITAEVNSTLGAAALSGSSANAIAASLSATLGNVLVSGEATSALAADVAVTLGAAALDGAAALAIDANLSVTLGAVELVSEATVSSGTSADLSLTLGDATLSGAANVAIAASVDVGLGDAVASAAAAVALSAALDVTLDAASISAVADTGAARSADLSLTLGDADLDAEATNSTPVEPDAPSAGGGGIIFYPNRHLPGFTVFPRTPLEAIEARLSVQLEDAKLVASAIVHESVKMRRRRHTIAVLLS